MTHDQYKSVFVAGAGAWGTSLAIMCSRVGLATTLWCRSSEFEEELRSTRENVKYLKGNKLPDELNITSDMAHACEADMIILATPAQSTREVASSLNSYLTTPKPLLITAKGLERETNEFLSDVVRQSAPALEPLVLSGPSFAADVARGLPTAITLAGDNAAQVSAIAKALSTSTFRIYVSDDMVGAQIGGAVKNVLAIASGICAGKELGASAQAALLARSFAELRRLAAVLGAKSETLFGLSGLGDLSLTCSSAQSRNFSLGFELGKGVLLKEILSTRRAVSEGVYTAGVVRDLAIRNKIDMPVSTAVASIVVDDANVDEQIMQLMTRPLKAEDE